MGPAEFLIGSQWRAWNGRLAVGIMGGKRLAILELDAAGTAVNVVDAPAKRSLPGADSGSRRESVHRNRRGRDLARHAVCGVTLTPMPFTSTHSPRRGPRTSSALAPASPTTDLSAGS